jgi:hypothetical protein
MPQGHINEHRILENKYMTTGYWRKHTGIQTVEDMYINEDQLKKYK